MINKKVVRLIHFKGLLGVNVSEPYGQKQGDVVGNTVRIAPLDWMHISVGCREIRPIFRRNTIQRRLVSALSYFLTRNNWYHLYLFRLHQHFFGLPTLTFLNTYVSHSS